MSAMGVSRAVVLAALVCGGVKTAVGEEKGEEKPRPELEGIAVNHIGGGVAGVVVTVYRNGKKIGEAKTSGSGEFSLALDIRETCTITVEMRREGYAPFRTETDFDPADPPYVDTELSGSLKLRGKVLGLPDEEPLSGASVRLSIQSKTVEGKSGADGGFLLEDVPPGSGRLEVQADGYGREHRQVIVEPDAELVTVSLKKERLIEITVLDDLERRVEGATIELQTRGPDGSDLRTQQTDKQGRSVFRNVHFDTTEARARIFHGDLVQSQQFEHVVEIKDKATRSAARLVVARAGKIAGKVVDAISGNPIHSARVIAGTPGQGFVPQSFTDFEGKFTLTGLPSGKLPVTVHHVDYAADLGEASCVAGKSVTVDFQLSAGKPLAGAVKGPDGKGLAGYVIASTLWKGYDTLSLRTFTDDRGRFAFEHVPPGEILFSVQTPDGAAIKKDIELQAGKKDHEVTVESLDVPALAVAVKQGDSAPKLVLTTLDGRKLGSAEMADKYVFLDFWATWCGPCIAELPNVQKLHRAVKGRSDFLLISISLDRNEPALRAFLEKKHMPWLHVFGAKSGAEEAAEVFGVRAIPSTFLIGPAGKIVAVDLRGDSLVDRVLDILPDKPSDTGATPTLR